MREKMAADSTGKTRGMGQRPSKGHILERIDE